MADYKLNIGACQSDAAGTSYKLNIGACQTDADTGTTYVDAITTIEGTSGFICSAIVVENIDAVVTISGTGSLTAYATANIRTSQTRTILVAIGNSQLYYEES